MAEIELERITWDGIETYLNIEKKVESKTYVAAQNREEAEEEFKQGPMYFIKCAGKIVGAISYAIKEDGSVYLNGLAIDPEYQGQGLAKLALERILEQTKEAPRVWLVVHPENVRAVALYESLGFRATDQKENYHGDGEPRLLLTLPRE